MSNHAMNYEFAERGKKLEPIAADEGIPEVVPFNIFFDARLDYLCAGEAAAEAGADVAIADHPLFSKAFPSSLLGRT